MTATETHTLEQIEEAQASLERVDGWINSCDAKAGILFAVIGVLLTIMFTGDGVKALYASIDESIGGLGTQLQEGLANA